MYSFDLLWEKALNIIENTNESIFITWKAWTWKSTLITQFLSTTYKNIIVLASTWISAINIWWSTIHSFFHIKKENDLSKLNPLTWENLEILQNCHCILIDEISMVRADILDTVDKIIQLSLNTKNVFWWVQMILVWDLFQLPPVIKWEDKKFIENHYKNEYFFESNAFKKLNPIVIELQKIYRQKDKKFIWILNKIRIWTFDEEDLCVLNQRVVDRNNLPESTIVLCSTNLEADKINFQKIEKLDSQSFYFDANVKWEFDEKQMPTKKQIYIKVWAQIIMLTNDVFWQNWTIWKFLWIDEDNSNIIKIEIDNQIYNVEKYTWKLRNWKYNKKTKKIEYETIWEFEQFPFKLAYWITIHKSQWLTFEKVCIDLWKILFAKWQAYVAISRVKSLEWLFLLREIKRADIKADKRVLIFMWKVLNQQKKLFIKYALENDKNIKFQYIKFNWEISNRIVKPLKVENWNYNWYDFESFNWFCFLRNEERNFNIDKMHEVEICE